MTKRKRTIRRKMVAKLLSLGVRNPSYAHTEIGYLLNRRPEADVMTAVLSCRNRKDPVLWLRRALGVANV